MKKFILFTVCFLFATFAFSQKKQVSKNRMVEFENGKKYEIETENENVTLLKVDGQTISKENYSKYQPIINRLQKGVQDTNLETNADIIKESSEQTITTIKDGDNTAITISGSEAENPIKLIVTKEGKIMFNGETLNDGSIIKLKTNKNISKNASSSEMPKASTSTEPKQKQQAVSTKKRVILQNEDSVQKVAQEDDEWLADELLKDKIIKNKDNIDFEITEKQMTVNGLLQSEASWRKYKSLYENHGVKFDKSTKININRSSN